MPKHKGDTEDSPLFIDGYFNPTPHSDNCGFHCIAHRLFYTLAHASPTEQQEFCSIYSDGLKHLVDAFNKYYGLDGNDKIKDFNELLALTQKFNHPIDIEIMWGGVLRHYFNTEKVRLGIDDLTEDTTIAEVEVKDLAIIMPAIGINISAKAKSTSGKTEDILPVELLDEYRSMLAANATATPDILPKIKLAVSNGQPLCIEVALLNKSKLGKYGEISSGHWLVQLPEEQEKMYSMACSVGSANSLPYYLKPKTEFINAESTAATNPSKLYFANNPDTINKGGKAVVKKAIEQEIKSEISSTKKLDADRKHFIKKYADIQKLYAKSGGFLKRLFRRKNAARDRQIGELQALITLYSDNLHDAHYQQQLKDKLIEIQRHISLEKNAMASDFAKICQNMQTELEKIPIPMAIPSYINKSATVGAINQESTRSGSYRPTSTSPRKIAGTAKEVVDKYAEHVTTHAIPLDSSSVVLNFSENSPTQITKINSSITTSSSLGLTPSGSDSSIEEEITLNIEDLSAAHHSSVDSPVATRERSDLLTKFKNGDSLTKTEETWLKQQIIAKIKQDPKLEELAAILITPKLDSIETANAQHFLNALVNDSVKILQTNKLNSGLSPEVMLQHYVDGIARLTANCLGDAVPSKGKNLSLDVILTRENAAARNFYLVDAGLKMLAELPRENPMSKLNAAKGAKLSAKDMQLLQSETKALQDGLNADMLTTRPPKFNKSNVADMEKLLVRLILAKIDTADHRKSVSVHDEQAKIQLAITMAGEIIKSGNSSLKLADLVDKKLASKSAENNSHTLSHKKYKA